MGWCEGSPCASVLHPQTSACATPALGRDPQRPAPAAGLEGRRCGTADSGGLAAAGTRRTKNTRCGRMAAWWGRRRCPGPRCTAGTPAGWTCVRWEGRAGRCESPLGRWRRRGAALSRESAAREQGALGRSQRLTGAPAYSPRPTGGVLLLGSPHLLITVSAGLTTWTWLHGWLQVHTGAARGPKPSDSLQASLAECFMGTSSSS